MKKDEVRKIFTECVVFADLVRNVFGDQVKIVYAKENGREIGKPSLSDRPYVTMDQIELGSSVTEPEEVKRKGCGK